MPKQDAVLKICILFEMKNNTFDEINVFYFGDLKIDIA